MPDVTLSKDEAVSHVTRALELANTLAANATSVANALVNAEIDGQKGHGFSRVASYAAQARSGKVDGRAAPSIEEIGASFLRVDAANGFAFPAIDLAVDHLVPLAKKTMIAAAGITRSHHCGQLGAHVERLAEAGLIAFMVANTPKAMAPWGGTSPLFGTNPIAFAAPREAAPPMVIDLSLSKVARGKVMAAAKAGYPIPEGWALDADGNPTTDAEAALKGAMVPAGDAKGAALAIMVEVLAATLIGANHSFEATSFFDAEGDPPGVGQFILVIDAEKVGGSGYARRFEALATAILSQEGTRLPGDGRLARRRQCEENGIAIPDHILTEIQSLANAGS